MKEKIVIITGASSGIGEATAYALASMGAHVVMACRDKNKSEKVRQAIIQKSGNKNVDLMICDLSSLTSVRRFASEFLMKYKRLDVLINNAGGIFNEKFITEDAFEWTLAVNHLGHFLLTNLLLDLLRESAPSRIINVSSQAHWIGHIEFDDLMFEKRPYNSMKAYGQAKLANILFAKELSRRLDGTGVTANSMHPGVVKSNFFNNLTSGLRIVALLGKPFMISPEKASRTAVFLATDDLVSTVSGKYFIKQKPARVLAEANNNDIAKILWMVSAQLTNL